MKLLSLFVVLLPWAALGLGASVTAPTRTELTADRMEMVSTDDETRAVCEGNVVLTGTNLRIVCDRLEVIASRLDEGDAAIPTQERFKYLLATGSVRIVQGDREATCGRAEVFPQEDRLILTEDPVLVDHASDFVAAGDRITLFRGESRVAVENPKFTGPPLRDLGPDVREPDATPPSPDP